MILSYSSLSPASLLRLSSPIFLRSASILSSYLYLGLPLIVLPSGFYFITLLGMDSLFIHNDHMAYRNYFSVFNQSYIVSYMYYVVHQFTVFSNSPGSIIILYGSRFTAVFLSHYILTWCFSICVSVQVLQAYITTSLIKILSYIFNLNILIRVLYFVNFSCA